jgi:methyl-accepting chemotaxis protein/hemerythrin
MTSSVQEGALAIAEVSKNIAGVAELSSQISSSTKNMETNSEKIKDRSIITYANAMEVGSIGDDIKTLINEFEFSDKINNEAENVIPKLCKFTPRWTVKVNQFDNDHIRIFDYINEIHGKIKEGATSTSLVETVEALAVFTTEHFAREEEVFIKTKYVDYDSHKEIHTKLLATVGDIVSKLKANEEVNLIEVMVFLKTWLYEHIFGIDKKYSSHLNSNGVF